MKEKMVGFAFLGNIFRWLVLQETSKRPPLLGCSSPFSSSLQLFLGWSYGALTFDPVSFVTLRLQNVQKEEASPVLFFSLSYDDLPSRTNATPFTHVVWTVKLFWPACLEILKSSVIFLWSPSTFITDEKHYFEMS